MIDFKKPTLEDRQWAEDILFQTGTRSCEDTFLVLYTWQRAYGIHIARMGDFLIGYMSGAHGTAYLYPMGRGDVRPVIEALHEDAKERGALPFRLICVTPEMQKTLDETFPGRFTYQSDRDSFDYVYAIDKLCDLTGKKLQSKRNHINRFVQNFPDWTAEPVTGENIAQCLEVERRWQIDAAADTVAGSEEEEDQKDEDVALHTAMREFDALGLEGILIRAGDNPIAFALGKQVSADSYNIHFEKADANIQGSYAIVNREYARWIRETYPTVRWINREDDMGVEGLRKAKESYHPDFLIEKHTAFWQE